MHRELFVAGLKGSRGKLAPTGWGLQLLVAEGVFEHREHRIQIHPRSCGRRHTARPDCRSELARELFVAGLKGSRGKLAPTGGGYNCSRPSVSLSTANIASGGGFDMQAGVIQRALIVGASLPREQVRSYRVGGYNCSRPRVSLSTANIASRSTREVTSAGAKMIASPVVLTCRPASYSARWTRAPLAPGASPGVS